MLVKDVTPKPERKLQIELSEQELNTLRTALRIALIGPPADATIYGVPAVEYRGALIALERIRP